MANLDKLSLDELEKVALIINSLLQEKRKTEEPETKETQASLQPRKRRRSRRQKHKTEKQPTRQTKRKGSRKGTMGIWQPVDTSSKRPNLFFKLGFDKLHKKDVAIDKKLAGNNEPTPRPTARLVEAVCKYCGVEEDVSPTLVIKDPDSGELQFVCDECANKRRGR